MSVQSTQDVHPELGAAHLSVGTFWFSIFGKIWHRPDSPFEPIALCWSSALAREAVSARRKTHAKA